MVKLTLGPLRDPPANRCSDSRTCAVAERLSPVWLVPAILPITDPTDQLSRTSLWWHLCAGARECGKRVTVSRIKHLSGQYLSYIRVQFQYSQALSPITPEGVRQEIRRHLDNWLRK